MFESLHSDQLETPLRRGFSFLLISAQIPQGFTIWIMRSLTALAPCALWIKKEPRRNGAIWVRADRTARGGVRPRHEGALRDPCDLTH